MIITNDLLTSWFDKLNKKTEELDIEIFRIIINNYCKIKGKKDEMLRIEDESLEIIMKICEKLMEHFKNGFINMESQILCVTSLYNLANMLPDDRKVFYMKILLNDDIVKDSLYERNILSFIMGLFQTDFIKTNTSSETVVKMAIKTTIEYCMKYFRYTNASFKALLLILEKISEWNLNRCILEEFVNDILTVIFYNWENSIIGVRELNLKIFHVFLKLVPSVRDDVLYNVTMMPWSRAKYYMLSETVSPINEELHLHCVEGLRYGFKCQFYLSSAKELYKILLESLKNYEDWNNLYGNLFKDALYGDDKNLQLNILNHCLILTLKKFPNLLEILLKDENLSFSYLFIIKIGRKNGQILTDWINDSRNLKKIIEIGLYSLEDDIRLQSFEIVCCSSKNTKIPSDEELQIVKDFLIDNINQDCSVFRQNFLNSLNSFFTRLKDSIAHNLKNNKIPKERFTILQNLFEWLYEFLIKNLKLNGNYQRKITSLKIIGIVLKITVFKRLFETDEMIDTLLKCIKDPSADIRDLSNNILTQYYIQNKYLKCKKDVFYNNGLDLCDSSLFYQVEIGSSMINLYFGLNKSDEIDIFKRIYDKALKHLNSHREDALYSICNGQSLYGALLTIEIYLKRYNIKHEDVLNIINLTCITTNYFLDLLSMSCDQSKEKHPPSFAEMDESIRSIISSSKYKFDYNKSNTQLSNAQQLVLNNIWLNIKACSELSSTIIEYCHDMLNKNDVERCIDVNIKILTRCRHKGAIEAAGTNIGRAVKIITSIENVSFKNVLVNILEEFLTDMISEKSSGASVTRRSAGLTILIHRFVTNDSQNTKPLFFIAIPKLLNYLISQLKKQQNELKRVNDRKVSDGNLEDDDLATQDIPEARALHLLCRTVTESSLSSYVIQFTSTLFEVSFGYFTDKQWQVRNGALQLYGSLIPKLVGQRMKLDTETPTMTIDELFLHIPILWKIVKKALESTVKITSPEETFNLHTSLIPILGFLSNTAKRYNVKLDNSNIPDIEELFSYLISLLNSPLEAIRNGAAKTIELFYNLETFYEHCKNEDFITTQNSLHGHLIVVKHYTKRFKDMEKYCSVQYNLRFVSMLIATHDTVMKRCKNYSFIIDACHLQILYDICGNCNKIDYLNILQETSNAYKNQNGILGIHHWSHTNISFVLSCCNDELLMDILKFCLFNFDKSLLIECILPALKYRINRTPSLNMKEMFKVISNIPFDNNLNLHKIIIEILYINIENSITDLNCDDILEYNLSFYNKQIDYKRAYVMPIISIIFYRNYINSKSRDVLLKIVQFSNSIKKSLNSNDYNAEYKILIIKALENLTKLITFLRVNKKEDNEDIFLLKINVYSSIFWLLQNEDRSVRYQCSKISLAGDDFITHPYNQLKILLSENFLNCIFDKNRNLICRFLQLLIDDIPMVELKDDDVPNPFDHQIKNIYLEPLIIREELINAITIFK